VYSPELSWPTWFFSPAVSVSACPPPERDAPHHRQEEAHLQVVPGRVHRSREDRERLHTLRPGAPSVRARGQFTGPVWFHVGFIGIQIVGFGSSFDFSRVFLCPQSHLIGIVVPDPEVFVSWAKDRGFVGSYEELCQNPVCHQNPNFITFFFTPDKSRKKMTVARLSTGFRERRFRGHESCREGSRAEVLWASEESLLTSGSLYIRNSLFKTDFWCDFVRLFSFRWRTSTCIQRRSASPTAFSPPRWKVDALTSAEPFRNKYRACTARQPFKGRHTRTQKPRLLVSNKEMTQIGQTREKRKH